MIYKMRLFCIQMLFLCLLQEFGGGVKTYEERAEYVTLGGIPTENENETDVEGENLWEDPLGALLLELDEDLLENFKTIWNEETDMNFPDHKTLLATFDSSGLVEVSLYNDTSELRQALTELRPRGDDAPKSTPTLEALLELLQNNLSDSSLLLATASKPSDEDLAKTLTESLMRKNLKLSVLWLDNQTTNDNSILRDAAMKTGGRFKLVNGEKESVEEGLLQKSSFQNLESFSENVRFPEDQKDFPEKEMPLAPRAANQKAWQKVFVPLIVEVASGSSLEMRPGAPTQIQFTVKNNLNAPLSAFFNAKFNGVNQNVQPPQAMLQPSASATVIVNLQPVRNAESSALGTVTLGAVVANRIISRSALIFLTPQTITDKTEPKMYYKYEGDCSNYKDPQVCENGHWSLEATVSDEESGLLKVLSEPYGLLFQSEFIAGTKTPVTVYYGATCCQPIVQIWAEDLRGNYVKKSFDVFNQNLLAGEITSIVLGILLLLLIIIGIIVAVVLVKRRNRRNMIIPRARSGSR